MTIASQVVTFPTLWQFVGGPTVNYIGWIGLALFLLGMVKVFRRKRRPRRIVRRRRRARVIAITTLDENGEPVAENVLPPLKTQRNSTHDPSWVLRTGSYHGQSQRRMGNTHRARTKGRTPVSR